MISPQNNKCNRVRRLPSMFAPGDLGVDDGKPRSIAVDNFEMNYESLDSNTGWNVGSLR